MYGIDTGGNNLQIVSWAGNKFGNDEQPDHHDAIVHGRLDRLAGWLFGLVISITGASMYKRYAIALGFGLAVGFLADLLLSMAFSRQMGPQDVLAIVAAGLTGLIVVWTASRS
jgi:hypothetical protein